VRGVSVGGKYRLDSRNALGHNKIMKSNLCPTCGRWREYCDGDPEIACVEAMGPAAGVPALTMARIARTWYEQGSKYRQEISNLQSELRTSRDLIDRLNQVIEALRK